MDRRVAYALDVLLGEEGRRLGLVAYGSAADDGKSRIRIVESGFFGAAYGSRATIPRLPLPEIQGVPFLFGEPRVERRGDTMVVHADLVASAYFLLTRYEEWVRREVRDQHGRFPGRESLPCRAGFIDRPVVDEYARLLRGWAASMGVNIPCTRRQFSVLLTHDVDLLGTVPRPISAAAAIVRAALGRRSWGQAADTTFMALGLRRHPLDNLADVVRLDGRLNEHALSGRCRSIYFFLAGGATEFDNGRCDLGSRQARRALKTVRRAGAEIGLHSSYEAGIDPGRIATERAALEAAARTPITKNRHHFLALREPEHAADLAAAGITWDSTLGYADIAGFRLGVCRPVPLFDPIRRTLFNIEEHPLTVMDCTLTNDNYMNMDEEESLQYVKRLADATFVHQGEFVALWHNTVLAMTATGCHRRLYTRVLDHVAGLLGAAESEPQRSPCVS